MRKRASARNVKDSGEYDDSFGYGTRTEGENKLGRTDMFLVKHCKKREKKKQFIRWRARIKIIETKGLNVTTG